MSKTNEHKIAKRQLRSSYITSTISIALVLFLIGIIGLLLLNANRMGKHVKENLGFTILLKDNVREAEVKKLEKQLAASQYVKSVRFVGKDEAAQVMKDDLGEDFVEYLGYNPLLASMDVKLYADYTTPEQITKIEADILKIPEVKEIYYQKDLLAAIHQNIRKISIILAGFSGLMLLIAIALINNTIRLSIYSKRFLIRTMQLVGATHSHIRKPFLLSGLFFGFLGSIIAILLLSGLIYISSREFKGFIDFAYIDLIGLLFILVITIGLLLTFVSTYFAVNKYLNIKSNKLYA